MSYFTTKCCLFLVPSNTCHEEFKKIDVFLEILEESKVGEILYQEYLKAKKTVLVELVMIFLSYHYRLPHLQKKLYR